MNIKYRLTSEEEKRNNKIIGDLFVLNTDIKFIGNNNIIYVNGSVSLVNSNIYFRGNNSLIYICNTDDKLTLDIKMYNNSVLYFGEDMWINRGIKIVIFEQNNVFFLKENSHYFVDKEIEEFSLYPHDDYIYEKDDKTLSFEKIEEDLNRFSVKEKIEYLTDITNNKSKNRFFIE